MCNSRTHMLLERASAISVCVLRLLLPSISSRCKVPDTFCICRLWVKTNSFLGLIPKTQERHLIGPVVTGPYLVQMALLMVERTNMVDQGLLQWFSVWVFPVRWELAESLKWFFSHILRTYSFFPLQDYLHQISRVVVVLQELSVIFWTWLRSVTHRSVWDSIWTHLLLLHSHRSPIFRSFNFASHNRKNWCLLFNNRLIIQRWPEVSQLQFTFLARS